MEPSEETTARAKRNRQIIFGLLVPNLFAVVVIWFSTALKGSEDAGVLIFSEFVIIPLLMGIISAWFWRDSGFRGKQYTGYSLLNGLIGLALSAIFLGEGYICLLIVSPLVFGFIIGGAFLGKVMFRKGKKTLNTSIIGLLLVAFTADSLSEHFFAASVSDVMLIQAPVNEVWKYVVAYEPIKEKNNFWMFRIGMPSPVQSTVDGYCAGAGRKCIFSNGYVFDEKMVVYEPGKNLTFDITHQPRDPEIMGHIDILRGQFLLRDNGDGTTTLTGTSWYRLYVFPSWYYDIWARSITRNVHLRVMDHIKKLSEKKQ